MIVAEGSPGALGGRAASQAQVSWQDRDGPRSEQTAEPTRMVARLAARYDGDGPLVIAISDTGAGMPETEVAQLLEPGPIAADARPRGVGADGLGLGLPLVQALAAANGAKLAIESAPGKGTSARVVFGKDRVVPV